MRLPTPIMLAAMPTHRERLASSVSTRSSITCSSPGPAASDGAFDTQEGCLSLTGERRTLRYRRIEVNYENRRFRARHATFAGWTAQIIQHEVDHCNGIII